MKCAHGIRTVTVTRLYTPWTSWAHSERRRTGRFIGLYLLQYLNKVCSIAYIYAPSSRLHSCTSRVKSLTIDSHVPVYSGSDVCYIYNMPSMLPIYTSLYRHLWYAKYTCPTQATYGRRGPQQKPLMLSLADPDGAIARLRGSPIWPRGLVLGRPR